MTQNKERGFWASIAADRSYMFAFILSEMAACIYIGIGLLWIFFVDASVEIWVFVGLAIAVALGIPFFHYISWRSDKEVPVGSRQTS